MTAIRVLSARAPQMALQKLFADFTRATGHAVTASYGTVGAIGDRFKGGEAADLLFHALVLLAERGLEPATVLGVLRARHLPQP